MMRSLLLKRCLVLMLVFSLFSSGAVLAEEQSGERSLKLNFNDVPDGNWAQKHVSKLALLGVTEGYPDGSFRPDTQVTQQDVIKMALSLMGYSEDDANIEMTQAGYIINFLNEHVADYAQPFVSLAFDLGILDYSFESSNVSTGKWGEKKATREWVAKMIVQAIGEEDLADTLSNTSSKFTDSGNISGWALGYVNAAVELDIVTGNTDGTFKPKDSVTRAQLAAFLSRGENYLTNRSDLVHVGTLIASTFQNITILNDKGQNQTFALHEKQKYYSYKVPNNAISGSQLELYTKVAIIALNGTAYYVELIDDETQLVTIDDVVLVEKSLQGSIQTVQVVSKGQNQTYILDPNVSVLNKQGGGLKLSDLVAKSTIRLKFDTIIGNPLNESSRVIEIVLIKEPVNKKIKGHVSELDVAGLSLTYRDAATQANETYPIAPSATITYGSKKLDIGNIGAGDEVDVTIEDSIITSLDVTYSANPYVETIEGIIHSFDASSGILTIKNNEGRFLTNSFANSVTVILPGANSPTTKQLENNDHVKIQINSLDEIIRVEVMNREIKRLTQVEIFDYDDVTASLVVRMDHVTTSYKVNEDTVITMGELKFNMRDFDFRTHFTRGKRVDMTFTNDKLMAVNLSSYYDGVVKEIDARNRTFTLAMDSIDQRFTLQLNSIIETYNNSSTSFDLLSIGDTVRVHLNANQTEISRVQVKQAVLYRVVSTKQTTREVIARDQSGEEHRLFINSTIPLNHYAKLVPVFTDIKENDLLIATYSGRTIESVEISQASIGTIKENNAFLQKLVLSDYSNVSKEWTWREAPETYNGATGKVSSLSTLAVGDRIQVVENTEGKLFITSLEVRTKQYWGYDATTNIVSYRKVPPTENNEFILANGAYIHDKGKMIAISTLTRSDAVKFYMLNGIVYEIEKYE